MLPVVARGAATAAKRGLPALLNKGRALAQRIFTANPAAAAAAARRVGISGAPAKVLEAMKNNKVMTALVALELGTEGYELLQELAAEDAEIAEMISRYGVTNDKVPENANVDLATQIDEMQAITDAANAIGGLTALHALRRALSLDEAHYQLYDQLKLFGRVVR